MDVRWIGVAGARRVLHPCELSETHRWNEEGVPERMVKDRRSLRAEEEDEAREDRRSEGVERW